MRFPLKKPAFITLLIVIALAAGIFAFVRTSDQGKNVEVTPSPAAPSGPVRTVIGASVQGREIESYTYGQGATRILFVGGVHGGYEWNSVLLAYRFMDYLDANPLSVPKNVSISIIPTLNPDGVYLVTGEEGRFDADDVSAGASVQEKGRFNANNVDLNRNFDCKWKPTSTWRSKTVSAGKAPFSEPEAAALRDYVEQTDPVATVFWHSQSNAVYASECKNGILAKTIDLMNAYSKASGYPPVRTFDAYEITGDAEGWLASLGIPAITVELKTHESIEWDKNIAGIQAVLSYVSTNYGP